MPFFTIIVLLALLIWQSSCVVAAPPSTTVNKIELQFPLDVSCGRLFICPQNWDVFAEMAASPLPQKGFYSVLGDAKGTIVVAANSFLKFTPSSALLQNPALLDHCSTDCIAVLNLGGANVDENVATLVHKLAKLRRLEFTFADMDDAILKKINPGPDLQVLKLNKTPIEGKSIGHFAYLKKLRVLVVEGDLLKHEGYRQIASLTGLAMIDLSRTSVDDGDLAYLIPRLPELKGLPLVGCRHITPACLKSVALAPKLIFLNVSGTSITAKSLIQSKLKGLKKIQIKSYQGSPADFDSLREAYPNTQIDILKNQQYDIREVDSVFHPLH